MMKTRQAFAVITYRGKNITTALDDYATAFSYTDPAGGESDSISLTIADPAGEWIGGWLPTKGDRITAQIKVENWEKEGDTGTLNCGSFFLDEFSFSESNSGRRLNIGATSAPLESAFKSTKRTTNIEGRKLSAIAGEIAQKYNLQLAFDGKDVTISADEQAEQTDAEFLNKTCTKYGNILKIFSNKIVIFDREAYKKKNASKIIRREDCASFSWKTSLAGSYTGGSLSYTDATTNKTISVSVGTDERPISLNESANNEEEAKTILQAAVDAGNHGETTASVSIMGDVKLTAGQCVELQGFGKLNGKYYIDKKSDSVSGSGFTSSLELSRVTVNAQQEARENAVAKLVAAGTLTDGDFWLDQMEKNKNVASLIVKAAAVIEPKKTETVTEFAKEIFSNVAGLPTSKEEIKDTAESIARLAAAGVITNSSYWQENSSRISQCENLLDALASAL